MTTEGREHAATQSALDKITGWARDVVGSGGENITFSVARQGASDSSDAFLAGGDCTPFTPSGHRGTLHGQAPGTTGEPVAYFLDFSGSSVAVTPVSFQFSFDLNHGRASVNGPFPNMSNAIQFTVELRKQFEGGGGFNVVFSSDTSSDAAAYVLVLQLVAA